MTCVCSLVRSKAGWARGRGRSRRRSCEGRLLAASLRFGPTISDSPTATCMEQFRKGRRGEKEERRHGMNTRIFTLRHACILSVLPLLLLSIAGISCGARECAEGRRLAKALRVRVRVVSRRRRPDRAREPRGEKQPRATNDRSCHRLTRAQPTVQTTTTRETREGHQQEETTARLQRPVCGTSARCAFWPGLEQLLSD